MLLVVRVFCLSSEVGCPRCVLKLLKKRQWWYRCILGDHDPMSTHERTKWCGRRMLKQNT